MRPALNGAAAALLFGSALLAPLPSQAQCLPMMCGFTESGKKGPFLKFEVTEKDLAKADAAIEGGRVNGALSAAGSINRGEFYGSGLKMPKTEAALSALVERLRVHWKYRQPPGQIRVRIVASMQFAPQAHPDGVIIVPLGMLIRARTDDQIAWLMGHEFAHLALGHFSREAKMRKTKRATSAVVAMLQGGVSMSQTDFSMRNGQLQTNTRHSPQAQALSDRIYLRSRDLNDILALANQFFSRKQEDQADVLGLDLAIAAGFNDGGASDALNEYGRMEAEAEGLFKAVADEMAEYTKIYASASVSSADNVKDIEKSGKNFLNTFLENLKTVALNKVFDYYNKSHRPTEKRRQGILKYYGNAYRGAAPNPESTAWLEGVRDTTEFQQGKIVVTAVAQADDLLRQDKIAEAVTELKPAFATEYGTTPFLANAAAEVYWRAGRTAEADRQFSIAERLPGNGAGAVVRRSPAKPKGKAKGKAVQPATQATDLVAGSDQYFEQNQPGFHRHITLLTETKSYTKALNVIDVASVRFGDDYAFLPAKIRIYFALRKTDELAATLAKCAGSQDEGLRRQCSDAIFTPEQEEKLALLSPVDRAKLERERERLAGAAESKSFWDQIASSLKPSDD